MICIDSIYEGNFNWYSKGKARSNGWNTRVKPLCVIENTIQGVSNGTEHLNGDFVVPFEYLGRV